MASHRQEKTTLVAVKEKAGIRLPGRVEYIQVAVVVVVRAGEPTSTSSVNRGIPLFGGIPVKTPSPSLRNCNRLLPRHEQVDVPVAVVIGPEASMRGTSYARWPPFDGFHRSIAPVVIEEIGSGSGVPKLAT